MQCAFRDVGVVVPRDTDMQRDAIGSGVPAGGAGELQRGDLLYLPGHVLIHAGDAAVIHADGASMMVRRDDLAQWMQVHGVDFADIVVRRA